MNEQDLKKFLKILEKEKQAVSKHTKEQSIAILHSIGVLTKNGNPTKRYKDLCIPKEQA
jgi:hypothetical protein